MPINTTQLRNHYLPEQIKILFVAEAAPDSPERFFYYDNVQEHDWLYLALMRALYKETRTAPVDYLRGHKSELLKRFQEDGYYVIDAINDPVAAGLSSSQRTTMVHGNADKKIAEIKSLLSERGDSGTKIILIKATVFEGLYERLTEAALPVINDYIIPFPSSGQQQNFAERMQEALTSTHL